MEGKGMKHYDHIEWVLYKNKLLDDAIYKEMEEHLLLCDGCMETFLSLIDQEEIQRASDIVPEDFTIKVMKSIKGLKSIKKPIKKKSYKKVSKDFFIYYIAVASVAIAFTAGGVFTNMVDTVPKMGANISIEESLLNVNTIYNFTEKITNHTSKFINNFQIKIVKED